MLETAEQLQVLVNRAAAQQLQTEQITRARQMGDEDAARFYELRPEQQTTLYAKEAIADATDAFNAGDVAGFQRGVSTAVEKVLYQGAQLGNPRAQRPLPRRKRGR